VKQNSPVFSILLPIHRSPELLEFSIASILAQTQRDFELFIICDGAPTETNELACEYAKQDNRIKALCHEKGKRHGETYRHTALLEAKGKYVAQIADDDLWFPDHLEVLEHILKDYDFAHTIHFSIKKGGKGRMHFFNLSDQETRSRMISSKFNFFGPTFVGYRMSAYMSLAEGWSPAPTDIWSDLWMWRKFLNHPDFTFLTEFRITAISLPSPLRAEDAIEERYEEMKGLSNDFKSSNFRDVYWKEMLCDLAIERNSLITQLKAKNAELLARVGIRSRLVSWFKK
jgi:glycosyltransferase involved in cell wall biosynthesis